MKISGLQLFWIFFSFIIGNVLLLSVSPTTVIALQDSWISYLIAMLLGLLFILIATKIYLLYPNLMFFELTKKIVGKWLGIVIFFVYLFSWFAVLGNLLAEFAVFTIEILLPKTPIWVVIVTMLLLAIYLAYIGGIEGIGRCSEVFGPIIFIGLFTLTIISAQNIELDRVGPIFVDSGFFSILKASIFPFSIIGESILLLVLLPFADQPKLAAIKAAWGMALSSLLTTIIVVFVIMTFGPEITAKSQYPAFSMISYINIMNFIQNLEIVAVLVWIISIFIKISLYFFITSYSMANFLKLKDWRKSIWFVACITLIIAIVLVNFHFERVEFLTMYWIPYVIPINMVGIPLLLLVVGKIRKHKNVGKNTKKQDTVS